MPQFGLSTDVSKHQNDRRPKTWTDHVRPCNEIAIRCSLNPAPLVAPVASQHHNNLAGQSGFCNQTSPSEFKKEIAAELNHSLTHAITNASTINKFFDINVCG